MRRIVLLIVTLLALACGAARADDFSLPGLAADSDAYAALLTKRFPAGGTPQARRQAEAQADAAIRKNDWAAAAAALETRVALGDAGAACGWRSPRRRSAAPRPRPAAPCRRPGRTSARSIPARTKSPRCC